MTDDLKIPVKIHVARVDDARALEEIAPALAGQPHYTLQSLARDVKEDRVGLWAVYSGEPRVRVGSMALRIDTYLPGETKELVVVAGCGRMFRGDLTQTVMPALESLAAHYGCKTIMTETNRPGLVEKLTGQGWDVAETVLRKKL